MQPCSLVLASLIHTNVILEGRILLTGKCVNVVNGFPILEPVLGLFFKMLSNLCCVKPNIVNRKSSN